MKIVVNGDTMELDEALTVRQLIERLGLSSGPVAVEQNGVVVPRANHTSTILTDGDVVEIVHFVGGG